MLLDWRQENISRSISPLEWLELKAFRFKRMIGVEGIGKITFPIVSFFISFLLSSWSNVSFLPWIKHLGRSLYKALGGYLIPHIFLPLSEQHQIDKIVLCVVPSPKSTSLILWTFLFTVYMYTVTISIQPLFVVALSNSLCTICIHTRLCMLRNETCIKPWGLHHIWRLLSYCFLVPFFVIFFPRFESRQECQSPSPSSIRESGAWVENPPATNITWRDWRKAMHIYIWLGLLEGDCELMEFKTAFPSVRNYWCCSLKFLIGCQHPAFPLTVLSNCYSTFPR